jgi:hypothetical protein
MQKQKQWYEAKLDSVQGVISIWDDAKSFDLGVALPLYRLHLASSCIYECGEVLVAIYNTEVLYSLEEKIKNVRDECKNINDTINNRIISTGAYSNSTFLNADLILLDEIRSIINDIIKQYKDYFGINDESN